jgi:hypothetical protein
VVSCTMGYRLSYVAVLAEDEVRRDFAGAP